MLQFAFDLCFDLFVLLFCYLLVIYFRLLLFTVISVYWWWLVRFCFLLDFGIDLIVFGYFVICCSPVCLTWVLNSVGLIDLFVLTAT